jgi:hypothetical protein
MERERSQVDFLCAPQRPLTSLAVRMARRQAARRTLWMTCPQSSIKKLDKVLTCLLFHRQLESLAVHIRARITQYD